MARRKRIIKVSALIELGDVLCPSPLLPMPPIAPRAHVARCALCAARGVAVAAAAARPALLLTDPALPLSANTTQHDPTRHDHDAT